LEQADPVIQMQRELAASRKDTVKPPKSNDTGKEFQTPKKNQDAFQSLQIVIHTHPNHSR
jgi:hypothetical protein